MREICQRRVDNPSALIPFVRLFIYIAAMIAVALRVLFRELHKVSWLGMKLDVPVFNSVNIPSLVLTFRALLEVSRFPQKEWISAAIGW